MSNYTQSEKVIRNNATLNLILLENLVNINMCINSMNYFLVKNRQNSLGYFCLEINTYFIQQTTIF